MIERAELFSRCRSVLSAHQGRAGHAWFIPGRIEVLGKHTDYAGGRSLLCAVDRGFAVVSQPRGDGLVRVTDVLRGETRELTLGADTTLPQGDWGTYPAAVTTRVPRDFPAMARGADIAFASNLPAASGMSSSSALLIGLFLALHNSSALGQDSHYSSVIDSSETLAGYLGAVENGREFGALAAGHGVGTLGGSQDHTAILCCVAGAISGYAFCPVRAEGEVRFPSTHVFVVAFSGVAAQKSAAAMVRYNEAALATAAILELWNAKSGSCHRSLGEAVSHSPGARDSIRSALHEGAGGSFTAERLLARYDQFVVETFDIIPAASAALVSQDLNAFGALVDRSHRNAESLLGNQVPETVWLQRQARELGADAASAFGAGFGGSVWAMIARDAAPAFAASWRERYAAAFPAVAAHAQFIVTSPGAGAARVAA